MSEMNVNGIVLNDIVTKQLSQLQDEYARVLSDGLSNIMDFILEDCVLHSTSGEKKLLEYIETIHAVRKTLLRLVPQKKGGEL